MLSLCMLVVLLAWRAPREANYAGSVPSQAEVARSICGYFNGEKQGKSAQVRRTACIHKQMLDSGSEFKIS